MCVAGLADFLSLGGQIPGLAWVAGHPKEMLRAGCTHSFSLHSAFLPPDSSATFPWGLPQVLLLLPHFMANSKVQDLSHGTSWPHCLHVALT